MDASGLVSEGGASRSYPLKVAYFMSRFPKLSETFILNEVRELTRLGASVSVHAFIREKQSVAHPEVAELMPAVRFGTRSPQRHIGAQWHWLRRDWTLLARLWVTVLVGHRRSPRFLLRAISVVLDAAVWARRLAHEHVDHLHAHYATHPALAAYVVSRLTGIPFSFTVHAHDLYVNRTFLDSKQRAASFVVTISEFNQRWLATALGVSAADRVVVIRTGADLTVFQRRAAEPSGMLTLLAVGSLEPYKGHRYLVEACRLLRDAGVQFRCLIAGEGPERKGLEHRIWASGLDGVVQLLGAQPRQVVARLMSQAHVLVLPSVKVETGKMEGIPVVLMEAMAIGLPVIASELSGIPELVQPGRTGLLVPERDPPALAEALVRLAHDPDLRQRLGADACEKVRREYDLSTNARRLLDRMIAVADQ